MQKPYARLRSFNKNIFNPLILKFAGGARSPFAVIHHFGRRSGKTYATPLIVRQTPRGFVIALTYGPDVDWYRNVQAAGRATLLWHGREYPIEKPESLNTSSALLEFPLVLRTILRTRGTDDFVLVKSLADAQAA